MGSEVSNKPAFDRKWSFQPAVMSATQNFSEPTICLVRPQWNSSLDESQMEAVKHGLKKRLAIIQGPPGTGKTYVGLTIASNLLSNVQCSPIFVMCDTNHALDQFLEAIYSVQNNIVRLGGRSTNETLLKRSLKALKRGASISETLRSRHGELLCTKVHLEEQIKRCVFRLRARRIPRRMLPGIASQQQIESLYRKYPINDKTIEEVWLDGKEDELAVDKGGWKRKGKQNMLSTMHVTTYSAFSSLGKVDDHDEPNVIPTTADEDGELRVILTANDDKGESIAIPPADDDEVVPANPANKSSPERILGSKDVWLLPKKNQGSGFIIIGCREPMKMLKGNCIACLRYKRKFVMGYFNLIVSYTYKF